MKKLLFFSLILISTITFSQSPQFLNYQGVARDAVGTVINSGNIGIRFEIWRTSPSGTKVYQEEMSSTPSAAGIFTTAIGSGSNTIGTFSSINWANGPYFIVVGIDPTGGTSFSTVGTSQLLSVPYALYAETAGNATTFAAGNGITINSGTITNSAPNQTVNINGPNVIGTYPNYTITPTGPAAGNGISIVSGSVINTAPNQTVNINQSGIANVLGTYPNYTVDVANPNLNYNTGTQVLTLTQGTAVTTATISSSSTSVSITGAGVSGAYPNYTINPPPATSVTAGNSNITVAGTGPGFTVSSTPSLALAGALLSISNGNTVTLPTGTTYTNGTGISLISGTIITNTSPNQTVTISNGTNVNVTGTYPNFTVNSTPSLSIVSNTLSITGGNSVVLPSPPTPTAGAGISIVGGTITNTAPNQTVNISGPNVIGSYPNYTVAAGANPNIIGQGTATVTTAGNNYTVTTPATSLTLTGANNNVLSAGTNSVTLATYAAGTGLLMGGGFPNFTLSTSSTGTMASWSSLGNTGTNASSNFLGTTDAQDLVFRTANSQRMRLFNASGFVGIGNITTSSELLQVESGSNTAVSILSGTNSSLYFGNAGNHFLGAVKYDNINSTMSFWTNNVADRIFIENSGRVAIGSNIAVSELDVNGSLRLNGNRLFLGSVGGINSGYTGIYSDATGDLRMAVFSPGAPSNPPFASGGNSIDAMIIKNNNGYVGIGTNSPSNPLHVFSPLPAYIKVESSGATTQNGIIFKNPSREWDIINFTAGSDRISFYDATAVQERFTIEGPTGNVGIGISTPASRLHVTDANSKIIIDATGAGASTSSMDLKTASAGTATFLKFNSSGRLTIQSGGAYNMQFLNSIGGSYQFDEGVNTRLYIASGGNVGIRTTTPTTDLEVNGFTKLGSTAPAIKVLKLTGTTGATAGTGVSVTHGLTYAKILSVVVMVEDVVGSQIIPPNWGPANYQYYWDLGTTTVNVWTTAGNSSQVLSKPIRILITYEQ